MKYQRWDVGDYKEDMMGTAVFTAEDPDRNTDLASRTTQQWGQGGQYPPAQEYPQPQEYIPWPLPETHMGIDPYPVPVPSYMTNDPLAPMGASYWAPIPTDHQEIWRTNSELPPFFAAPEMSMGLGSLQSASRPNIAHKKRRRRAREKRIKRDRNDFTWFCFLITVIITLIIGAVFAAIFLKKHS